MSLELWLTATCTQCSSHERCHRDGSVIVFYWAALLGTDNINWIRNTCFLLSKYVLSPMERVSILFLLRKHRMALALLKYEVYFPLPPPKNPSPRTFREYENVFLLCSV